jgi:hypothetical protein
VLEGLDEVEWARLEHAYGKAEDVPGQIRDLTSRRAKKRERALYELYGNIWHQHTVYEATAHAVPFLVEIVLAESVAHETRTGVLMLLAEIADGESYVDVHGPLFEDMGVDIDAEPGQLERELEWVRAAHEAVHEHVPKLGRFLDSPDDDLRITAAYLVAKFPEDADELAPRLRRLYESERDAARRQVYALGLVTLRRADDAHVLALETLSEDVVEAETREHVIREAGQRNADDYTWMVFADLVSSTLS